MSAAWWERSWDWVCDQIARAAPPGSQPGWLHLWLGDAGERLAARHLRRAGMKILLRRHRTPQGEIDLICRDGNTVVFVEVKTRRGTTTGLPADAVDLAKQRQLTRLALAFLKSHRLLEHPARFDVVGIVWPDAHTPPQITHYRNAFEAHGRGQLHS
jgi:putative endonuclease